MNTFTELNSVNVNAMTENKNGLTYLSWAWAWSELKKRYPRSFFTIYENKDGWNYFTDGRTAWVKTGVTLVTDDGEGLELIEYLPVMDYRNKSIPLENITSFDVNKAIQRSMTKAVARHGLGLYIYAGEDLPEGETTPTVTCADCSNQIVSVKKRNGEIWKAKEMVAWSSSRFGRPLCAECMKVAKKAEVEAEKAEKLAANGH